MDSSLLTALVVWNSDKRFGYNICASSVYALSLHDALPISEALSRGARLRLVGAAGRALAGDRQRWPAPLRQDRKSTRLNSSHLGISYAVFCLKKKIATSAEPTSSSDLRMRISLPCSRAKLS